MEELFRRLEDDRPVLARVIGTSPGKLLHVSLSASDPHNHGRTVAILSFQNGSIVYKPRSGTCDERWFATLAWLNDRGFSPRLRVLQVVTREDYHWVERVKPYACRTVAEVRNFFVRAGAIACLGYLLRAKDWHCGNVIAAGDQPMVVDAEALWHVFGTKLRCDPQRILEETFLFATSSRSFGAFGGPAGPNSIRLGNRPVSLTNYSSEILHGFSAMWKFIFGNDARRREFDSLVNSIARIPRRRIYRATAAYAKILQRSLQPDVLRSVADRRLLLQDRCATSHVPARVIREEALALARADIPFFCERMGSRRRPTFGTLKSALRAFERQLSEAERVELDQHAV